MTYEECINQLINLQKETRNKLIKKLSDNNYDMSHCLGHKWHTGLGDNSNINDRRLCMWIPLVVNGKEYSINLFYNDIDSTSGNIHSQIGRISFVKELIYNKGSKISSPNKIINPNKDKKVTTIHFNSYKWCNPLDYMDNFKQKDCKNGKWLTVDDVLENDRVAKLVADAFKKFIENDQK